MRKERSLLRDVTNVASVRWAVGHISPGNQQMRIGAWIDKTCDGSEQRGLAGAVRSDNRCNRPLLDVKVDVESGGGVGSDTRSNRERGHVIARCVEASASVSAS